MTSPGDTGTERNDTVNIKQKQELEKLRSKWNLECVTAQKNKVAYVLKRSKDNYLRVMGSENGLLQYQAEVLELTTGIGNHKEVAIVERERIVDIVDDVFEHVPEDTVLGKLGVEIKEHVLGIFAKPKPKANVAPKPIPGSEHIYQINWAFKPADDALELPGPYKNKYRGASTSGHWAPRSLVAGVFAATIALTGLGLPATAATSEPVETQKLHVSANAAPSKAYRSFGIYVPQMIYPFDPSTIGDGWGWRTKACALCSTDHQGVDFLPGYGAEIPNIIKGTVVTAEYSGSLGVHVSVDDGYGMIVTYAHMIDGSIRVKVGDSVEIGHILGQVGNTGTSTGPHLHLAIQLDGVMVDPILVLNAFPVRPGLY